jgi:putative transposase
MGAMQKMNPPKCDDLDDIHFLIAAQKVFTCTEAARCQPEGQHSPAHDAFTRLLRRQPLDTEALWQEAKAFVDTKRGLLVLDDTTLDKPYAQQMELVTYHWSGKHQRVVRGIALLTLLWLVTFGFTTSLQAVRARTRTFKRCCRGRSRGVLRPNTC